MTARRRNKRGQRRAKSSWPGGRRRQLIDHAPWVRPAFRAGVRERYDVEVVVQSILNGRVVMTMPATIPIYGDPVTLRIEIDEFGGAVFVDGFPGELKHTYSANKLCMWYPSDPDDRRWTSDKGLLSLIDTALVHLFRERYYHDHPEDGWPGEEAPHEGASPKVDQPTPPSGRQGHGPVRRQAKT